KYHAPGSWLDEQPAAVTRKAGAESNSGSITYMGAWLDEPGMKREVEWMLNESGAHPDLYSVPAGVEVYRRTGNGRQIFIVENDGHDEESVELPSAMSNVLTGETVQTLKLPVYGVAVLEKAENK